MGLACLELSTNLNWILGFVFLKFFFLFFFRSVFVWKPKVESEEPQSEHLKRKQREFIYGSATGKKSNSKGPYNDSSDDEDRFGKDGKNKKDAKKTESKFTHNATKGKGTSKM